MSTEEPEPELAAGAGDGAFSLSTAVAGGAATDVVEGLGVRSETTHNNKHLSSNVRCWLSNNWKIITAIKDNFLISILIYLEERTNYWSDLQKNLLKYTNISNKMKIPNNDNKCID